jgi:hypothetical protein
VTSFWVEDVRAAEAKGARTRRGAKDFIMSMLVVAGQKIR